LKIKSVLLFSEIFRKISLSARYDQSVYWSSYKIPVILAIFKLTVNFPDNFRKNKKVSNLMKILAVGAESFHADRYEEANSMLPPFWESSYKMADL
jgi:hypothetical protein